jgi:phosphate transport system ATP-binding protein
MATFLEGSVPPGVLTAHRVTEQPTAPKDQFHMRILDLHFYYGAQRALQEIDLNLQSNTVTALIGPSGCGKSTLLSTMNRMYETIPGARMEGAVLLQGENVQHMDEMLLRRRVGMVFQRPNPFPKTIFDNVAFGLRLQGLGNGSRLSDAVETSLRRAGLWNEVKDKLKRPALSLSGGQQQRLCIARALAVEPEVLLLDEPCSALDPTSTRAIEELLLELKEACTIVIVTHNMQQAARVSDYTAFLLSGRLIEFDANTVIFRAPTQQETEAYITGRFG